MRHFLLLRALLSPRCQDRARLSRALLSEPKPRPSCVAEGLARRHAAATRTTARLVAAR